MFIPYFNTPDNYHKFYRDIKIANGFCMNCNKPLSFRHIYCDHCNSRKLLIDGLEGKRVRLGSVGKDTTNYQQYLHWSIFQCNVHINYRGKKEDRIKARVSKTAMNVATTRLRNALSCTKYTWLGKEHYNNKHNRAIYKEIKEVRNIDKRLVYNILLYYISYHLNNNNEFKTFVHFQTSMLNNLLINVENTYIRVKRPDNIQYFQHKRKGNSNKYWYWLFKEIDALVKPLMNEIIGEIY